MDTMIPVVAFVLLIVAGLIARRALLTRRDAERDRDDALNALETNRRISDATRDPVPVSDARDRLRIFGSGNTDGR